MLQPMSSGWGYVKRSFQCPVQHSSLYTGFTVNIFFQKKLTFTPKNSRDFKSKKRFRWSDSFRTNPIGHYIIWTRPDIPKLFLFSYLLTNPLSWINWANRETVDSSFHFTIGASFVLPFWLFLFFYERITPWPYFCAVEGHNKEMKQSMMTCEYDTCWHETRGPWTSQWLMYLFHFDMKCYLFQSSRTAYLLHKKDTKAK